MLNKREKEKFKESLCFKCGNKTCAVFRQRMQVKIFFSECSIFKPLLPKDNKKGGNEMICKYCKKELQDKTSIRCIDCDRAWQAGREAGIGEQKAEINEAMKILNAC